MPTYTNRLINEKSPYLLQHAHNPVDWYPWGEEAFRKAAEEDKPIFLSIGYATCHWCHVMEHESFENEDIAGLMNEAFVCIKVDREERPDIDQIYMTVCQMMTGQGGWPLSIIMTPDKKPFHAATYIPPDQRYGRIGMKQLIPRVSHAWENERERVLNSAGQITDVLSKQHSSSEGQPLDPTVLDHGYEELMREFDPTNGGFGQQPKFPMPHRLIFLLRQGREAGIRAAEQTLEAMRMGGIFDHIGFGFHRYSTDSGWMLPHFEKMLYDQALLTLAYTEAFELTGKPVYQQVVGEILEYVERNMTSPEGGFYSAEDADSEGEEGAYYTWSTDEVRSVLGGEYAFAEKIWNLSESGNFHDESTGQLAGKNIPHFSEWPRPDQTVRLDVARKKLLDIRSRRIHPLTDTKVLTDWNGLMIAAFARAGRVFDQPRWMDAAIRACDFLESELKQENGGLWHRWREGDRAVTGQLEDYAFIIFGLLELYESTFDVRYIESALTYNSILADAFLDKEQGGYYMTADHAEELIVRPKEIYDGAVPSGNSVQMYNLLKLARLTGRSQLEQDALEVGQAFGDTMVRSPSNFAQSLMALQYAFGESVEIVIVGERDHPEVLQMIKHIRSVYQPGKVVLLKDPDGAEALARLAPFTKELEMVNGRPTVYICRNFACEKPITSLEALQQQLK